MAKPYLASAGGYDCTARLWDVATAKVTGAMQVHEKAIQGVALSCDGRTLATASEDKTVMLWDLEAGTCKALLKGHTNSVFGVQFSPDGKVLASASWDS